jgi:hypothetical protein
MTDEEKRAYQASYESIRTRGENLKIWVAPEPSEEEKAERERMIAAGEMPF